MARNPLLWAAVIGLLLAGYKLRSSVWTETDTDTLCAYVRADASLDENRERLLAGYAMQVGYDPQDPVLVSRLRDLNIQVGTGSSLLVEDRILRLRLLQLQDQAWLATWQVPSAAAMPADWQGGPIPIQRYELKQQLENTTNALLPHHMPQASLVDIQRRFGSGFAATVTALPAAQWVTGVVSPFGLHRVWVQPLASEPESNQKLRQRQLRWQRAQQRIWLTQQHQAVWERCLPAAGQ